MFSAKVNTLLRELRHPNILQFLGSIVHGDEMILITEYLPKVSVLGFSINEIGRNSIVVVSIIGAK